MAAAVAVRSLTRVPKAPQPSRSATAPSAETRVAIRAALSLAQVQFGSETLEINNSTLSGNSSGDAGGAISIYGLGFGATDTLTINSSTLNGNSANSGGGIVNSADGLAFTTVTINNSTLSGNSASGAGGGISDGGPQGRERLLSTTAPLAATRPVSAAASSTPIPGVARTWTIGNTILKAGASGENIYNDGPITSLGYNLSSDDAGGVLTGIGDQINTDPMLGPLQDNGGPTFTHALLTGSSAIDAGKNFTAGTTDQRGPGFVHRSITLQLPMRTRATARYWRIRGADSYTQLCRTSSTAD